MITAIRAGWLLDGKGTPTIRNGCVLFADDRILDVGPVHSVAIPMEARVTDLPEHTLLPGLIDAHSHVGIHTLGRPSAQVARLEGDVVLDALEWLRADLESGVTTMRTLGDIDFLDVRFREAQRSHKIVAPRLQVAGNLVQSSQVNVAVSRSASDGPDAVRAAVRESIRHGCDWVKFYSTPDSRATEATLAVFSKAEVDVIFEEARRAQRPVSAHCHGGPAANWCIEQRIDSLEHGFFLDRQQMRDMAKHGLVLVPTCGVVLLQAERPSPKRVQEQVGAYLRMARAEGVECVPGTDAVHGRMDFEAERLVASGWSVGEAISSMTGKAAHLLRADDEVGTLAAGKVADLVAVRGDLSADIGCLRDVAIVIQGGTLVFDSTESSPTAVC